MIFFVNPKSDVYPLFGSSIVRGEMKRKENFPLWCREMPVLLAGQPLGACEMGFVSFPGSSLVAAMMQWCFCVV